MKYLFFVLICVSGYCFELKERLEKAKNGDYIVFEANKMITLLAIRSVTPSSIVLEEISMPTQNLKKKPSSWSEWIQSKAPGHSSWTMVEIDPRTGQVLECYSFSKSCWMQMNAKDSLLSTLLNLPLKTIPQDKQRKIGPMPNADEPDFRKVWAPPLTYEGNKIENALFDVFETVWPKDNSEIAGKPVALYFDQGGRFPLPFWIQVETNHVSATLRAIDSGRNLPNPHRTIPRRVPVFMGLPQKTENGLKFSLKSPKYYQKFELFAIDVTTNEKQIFSIAHQVTAGEGELIYLEVQAEELQEIFEPNHKYTWLLVPAGHSESYTELTKPYLHKTNS
jgi:hypothetical protein